MSFELWFAFAGASAILLAIPGPTVILVAGYALGRGRKTGWATVPGVTLGDFTAMTASLLGAGAVLATSADLFLVMKLAGALYLIWLGIQLWRADPMLETALSKSDSQSGRRLFWHSYVVTALNPKSIVFFIAFVPHFVDPTANLWTQFAILEATFLTLAALNILLWVLLADRIRTRIVKPARLRLVNRLGGTALIGAGCLTAAASRAG